MQSARVLIVDDQPLFRRGVALSLANAEGLHSVAEMCPDTLLNTLEARHSVPADVILYGNMTCGLTSLIVPWVAQRQPGVKVIVIAPVVDDADLLNALVLGIAGYLPRQASTGAFVGAVQEAARGGT